MIVTFGTQKGGVGKTTLAIAFANYLSQFKNAKVNVFDFDFQKSFYYKWEEEGKLGHERLYEVTLLEDNPFTSVDIVEEWSESKDINIIDLAGTLDKNYADVLMYSDYIIIPFEYSDVSVKSTIVFNNLLGLLESSAQKIFIRSRYDKGYSYLNQEYMDNEISKYGTLIKTPIYKRNDLQTINTIGLNYRQRKAVEEPFEEIIEILNIK